MELYGGKGTKLGATINTWLKFFKDYKEKFPNKLAKAKADKKYKEYVSKVASLYKKAKEKGKIAPLSHNDERKHAPQESKYDAPAKYSVKDLRAILKNSGVKNISKLKKAELLSLMRTMDTVVGVNREKPQKPLKRKPRQSTVPTVAQIKQMIKEKGFDIPSGLNKSQLLVENAKTYQPLSFTAKELKDMMTKSKFYASKGITLPKRAKKGDLENLYNQSGQEALDFLTQDVESAPYVDRKALIDLMNQRGFSRRDLRRRFTNNELLQMLEQLGDVESEQGFDPEDEGYTQLRDFAFNFGNEDKAYSSNTNKELRNMIAYRGIKPYKGARNKANLVNRLIYNDETGKGF